jgi:carboxyl-terminal processing protease
MKSILRIILVAVVGVLLIAGAFFGGFGASRYINASPAPVAPVAAATTSDGTPPEFQNDMPVFWEAWKIINDNFYAVPIDQEKLGYGAVSGMVDALGDEHTAFEDAKRAAYLQTQLSGSFEGIGATVEMVSGRLTIVAPIKGTPADLAGLQAGDVILQVDDTPIVNMDVEQAISIIRGPKGSTVHLKVQRGSSPAFGLDVTRDTINVAEVTSKMLDNDSIAYVQLSEFGEKAPDEMHKALTDALAKNPKALIFDLRGNPGGYLTVAIQVASEFINEGKVVLIEKFKTGEQKTYQAQAGGVATKIPMVLLVNEGSASASEILSASLRDYKRATIIGQKTYGKGSVQTTHTLSDASQLRVTIANFYSPLDITINHVAVTPDVVVPDPTDYERAHNIDPQLQKAIDMINNGEIKTAPTGTSSMAQPVLPSGTGLLDELRDWLGLNLLPTQMPS